MRARRSCLSVPASSQKMLDKARSLPADEVVIDLEDSVAAGAKEGARAAAVAAMTADWGGRSLAVRVNGTETPWFEGDVRELGSSAGDSLSTLVLPKVESRADVEAAARLLDATAAGRASPVGLQALIETAAGLVAATEIAGSTPRLETLIVGYADLSASLGRTEAPYPGDRWHWVRETVLANARAAGLAAIDGPFLEIKDADGLRESATAAAALGFDGKWAIHPSQLNLLNDVFSPSSAELERAEEVLSALDEAGGAEGRGAVALDGTMIDEASRKQAEAVVARGRAASG